MVLKKNKAIFLDRDGVINKDVHYLYKIEDFEFTENCIKDLRIFQEKGYLLFIVTNQSGIGRGYYTQDCYDKLTEWMLFTLKKNNINITKVMHCPHHFTDGLLGEYNIDCNCKKPKNGMLIPLIKNYNINTGQSIMIGDKISDIQAGYAAGISNLVLVESGQDLPNVKPNFTSGVYKNIYEYSRLI